MVQYSCLNMEIEVCQNTAVAAQLAMPRDHSWKKVVFHETPEGLRKVRHTATAAFCEARSW